MTSLIHKRKGTIPDELKRHYNDNFMINFSPQAFLSAIFTIMRRVFDSVRSILVVLL